MPGGKRRHWIAASLLLILAGGSLLLLVNSGSKSILTRTLPDGTIVTIRKVSYGKIYRDVAGNAWQRVAGRLLPEKYSKRLGVIVNSFTNATDTTFVVVETTRTNGLLLAWQSPINANADILLKDDVGNVFPLTKADQLATSSNREVEVFYTPLVSHLAREFHLHLSQTHWSGAQSANQPFSTEFAVRNPAPHSDQRWINAPLPLTNLVDGLKVELLELTSRRGAVGWTSTANPPERSTQARLRILQNGMPTSEWHILDVTVLDEEGNSYSPPIYGYPPSDSIVFASGFSPLETRKFQFALERIPSVRSEDTVTLTNVTVTDSQPASPITLDLHGFNVQFDELTQRHQFREINLRYHITPTPADFRHHVTIKSRDRKGSEIVLYDHDGGYSDGESIGLGFGNSRDVASNRVDVTFTMIKCEKRVVEFLARPSPLATNRTPAR